MFDSSDSFRFTHALCRKPGRSVQRGLRQFNSPPPDPVVFAQEHALYVHALCDSGLQVTLLDPLEPFPDSVFVEDPALCVGDSAMILRPGAQSRFDERDAAREALTPCFDNVIDLPGPGFVDGGDILLTGREAIAGISDRTDSAGLNALDEILAEVDVPLRKVSTPSGILHLKSDCGLLDAETVFCTRRLEESGIFSGYRVIRCPLEEQHAANVVRINDAVLVRADCPKTLDLLDRQRFCVIPVPVGEAAKLDGGLSCMSLRFSIKRHQKPIRHTE